MLRRSGGHLVVKEEGTVLTNHAETIDVVGAGVSATASGDHVTLTVAGAGGGVDTVGAVSGSGDDEALSISGTTITAHPATATQPGIVSEGAQTLGNGVKSVDALGLLVTTPSAPAAGAVMHAAVEAGRAIPHYIGPTGTTTPVQTHMGLKRVSAIVASGASGSSAGMIQWGMMHSTLGTRTIASFATTNVLTSCKRQKFVSAASAGSSAAIGDLEAANWFGNAAGLGGFFTVMRFGFSDIPATRRWMAGMSNTLAANITNEEPSAKTNWFGVGQDVADGTIYFMHNDAAGSCTKVDSGLASPTTANLLEVCLYATPNSSSVIVSVGYVNGAAPVSSTLSSDLPSNTTALAPFVWCNNESTAAVITVDLSYMYTETDF